MAPSVLFLQLKLDGAAPPWGECTAPSTDVGGKKFEKSYLVPGCSGLVWICLRVDIVYSHFQSCGLFINVRERFLFGVMCEGGAGNYIQ